MTQSIFLTWHFSTLQWLTRPTLHHAKVWNNDIPMLHDGKQQNTKNFFNLLLRMWNSTDYWAIRGCFFIEHDFKRLGSALCLLHTKAHTTHTHKLPFSLQNLLRPDKCGTCNCARALISPCWLIMALWKPCAHYAHLCCFYCSAQLIIFSREFTEFNILRCWAATVVR